MMRQNKELSLPKTRQFLTDHGYTCIMLMWLQSVIKRQQWKYGISSGWRLMEGPHSQARCIWPDWLVLLECRLWNSRLGQRAKQWIGTGSREHRLQWMRTWRFDEKENFNG